MLLHCKLCPALFTCKKELNEHFDLHFAEKCGNCDQQLIVINERYYYLQLHDDSSCNKENLAANCNGDAAQGTRRTASSSAGLVGDFIINIPGNKNEISRTRKIKKEQNELVGDGFKIRTLESQNYLSLEQAETRNYDEMEHFEVVECMEVKIEQEPLTESQHSEIIALAETKAEDDAISPRIPNQPANLSEEEFKKLPSYRISAKSTGEKQLREYQCDICEKYLLSKRTLAAHMKLHQPDISSSLGNNICDVCGKVLKSKNGLKSHKETHLETRRYICSYCGKGFRIKNNMIEHTNTHTGTSAIQCLSISIQNIKNFSNCLQITYFR